MRRSTLGAVLALAAALGCASAGGGDGGSDGGSRNRITRAELSEPSIEQMSAYQAIQRLRPVWLRPRSSGAAGTRPEPVVFLNGNRYGGLASLRRMEVSEIAEMEFIPARDATIRWGTGVDGGVINVVGRSR